MQSLGLTAAFFDHTSGDKPVYPEPRKLHQNNGSGLGYTKGWDGWVKNFAHTPLRVCGITRSMLNSRRAKLLKHEKLSFVMENIMSFMQNVSSVKKGTRVDAKQVSP